MNRDVSARLPEALVRAVNHWETEHKGEGSTQARALPLLTIAFSRQAGALGHTVAREVGARLSWPVYDHELLEKMASEMHVAVRLLESIDERHVHWLLERIEAFSAIPFVSETTYVRRLLESILSLAARGQCVIVGRGSPHVLPPLTTLRVRLVASLDDRVRVMLRELAVTRDEAQRRIKTIDRQRAAFVKEHFHRDPAQPENYDLVLNTSRLSVASCASTIIAALESRQRERQGQRQQPVANVVAQAAAELPS